MIKVIHERNSFERRTLLNAALIGTMASPQGQGMSIQTNDDPNEPWFDGELDALDITKAEKPSARNPIEPILWFEI